ALMLLVCTGLRRGDVVRIGRQHIRRGVLSLKTSKTKAQIDLPVLSELQSELDRAPIGMTFLVSPRGGPFSPDAFAFWFRQRCREAGLEGLSSHGLRKLAATRLAEHGATAHEIMAVMGWAAPPEAQRYTRGGEPPGPGRRSPPRRRTARRWHAEPSSGSNRQHKWQPRDTGLPLRLKT